MRIECHPDRLKQQPGLTKAQMDKIDENAKRIGGAAEVLLDEISRGKYDLEVGRCCR